MCGFAAAFALLGIGGAWQPAQAQQEVIPLPDPHLYEGARSGHYADYFAEQLAGFDFDSAFRTAYPDNPFSSFDEKERLREAVTLLAHLTDVARHAPDTAVPCALLDPVIAAVPQGRIVGFHASYPNWGPDGYEPRLLATLGRLHEARIRGCIRQHGAVHARTRAVVAERDALYAAFAASTPQEQSSQDVGGTDPIVFSLLGNQIEALAAGDFKAAKIYRAQASDRIAVLEMRGQLTDYLVRMDSFAGAFSGLGETAGAPAAASRLDPESLALVSCYRTLSAAIAAGIDHAAFWKGDTGVCPNDPGIVMTSPATYSEMAERVSGGLFAAGEHHDISQLARSYPALLAARNTRRAVESEEDGRTSSIRFGKGASDEVLWLQRRLLDAMWYARLDQPREGQEEEAFAILQHVNTNQAVDAIAMGVAQAKASERGLRSLLAELDEINKIDFAQALAPRIRVRNPEYEATEEYRQAQSEMQRIEAQFERRKAIFAELQSDFPEYFSLIQPRQLSLAETKSLLGPDEAIFVYLPNIMGSHGFLVTADAHQWLFDEGGHFAATRASTKLLWDVFADVDIPQDVDTFWTDEADGEAVFSRSVAHDLYRRTLGRHEAMLAGKKRIFTLTNTGGLANLPFALLVTDEPMGSDSDAQDLRETAWLGDKYELGKLPTLQTLKILRERGESVPLQSTEQIFGIGDPALEGRARERGITDRRARLAQSRSAGDLRGLPALDAARKMSRLPGTRAELDEISTAFGSDRTTILLGDEATEPALRQSGLGDAGLLIFATHGVMAGQLGGLEEAALILTPAPSVDTVDAAADGVLTASEIAGLDLAAQWAVLSACNTATGEGGGAPGLSGLSRAFFYAGVENILASLWPVDDAISPKLTVGAITGQQNGLSRGAALQASMRAVRDDTSKDGEAMSYAHPMFWAPFVLIGDVAN